MWISSIKLKNFKSYAEAHFEFPEPKDGKNLVIIGAKNGHGKTTLLEALYLGLYDQDAILHLDRAGVIAEKRSYPDYLNHALYHEAKTSYGQQYSIEIVIDILKRNVQGKVEGIRIKRQWFFDYKRQLMPNTKQAIFCALVDEGYSQLSSTPIDDEDVPSYFESYALPIDYAPFFFFDGEKIVSSARATGAGVWLSKALRGLLGVTLLEQLRESLISYRNQYVKAGSSNKIKGQIDEQEKKMATARVKLQIAEESLEQEQRNREQLRLKFDELMLQLGASSPTDIKTSQDIIEAITDLEQNEDSLKKKVKFAFESLPLALLPREQIETLLAQLEQEKTRLEHEAGKGQIEGKVDEFWQQFVQNSKVREVLGRSAESILNDELMKEAVHECWELLYYPLPTGCAEQIKHNYLSQTTHAHIVSEYRTLGKLNTQSMSDVIEQIEQSKHKKADLHSQLNEMKGTGRDQLIEYLQEVKESLLNATQMVGNRETQKLNAEREYVTVGQALQRLADEHSANNPRLIKANRSRQVQTMIEDLTKQLMKAKVDEVSQFATLFNHKIAHDHRIDKIKIDEQAKMQLIGRNGIETDVDLSAGQIQVLMTALISAMAEVTNYEAPFMIDTPLARLDLEHRQGIFDHWVSLEQQVILLAQDAEINADVAQKLSPYVNKTYLVTAESLESAGATSSIQANAYFQ